jgi:hypothetical protein
MQQRRVPGPVICTGSPPPLPQSSKLSPVSKIFCVLFLKKISPTSRSEVNLISWYLVNKLSIRILWNPKIHDRVHNSPPVILIQINSGHALSYIYFRSTLI